MKTIIYTGAFRFPIGDAAASRVLSNAKVLRELGHNVVFLSWGGVPNVLDKFNDGDFYYHGFRYVNTDDIDVKTENPIKRLYNFFFSGVNALKIIVKMINDVDIVIGYNPPFFFTKKILTICKKYNIPFISDVTEWYNSNELPGGLFAPPAWVNYLNMTLVQKQVKNKIVISSFLDNYYKSSNNIKIPPLVDSNDSKWGDLNSVLPPFDGVRLVYAGSPAKKDLLETMLLAILKSVKEGLKLQFVIVGVSKEHILGYCNNKEILTLSNNFIFCGRVAQTLVPSYYNVSDFSIIIRENTRKNMAGFPTKLAESMMAGCPVLLNRTSDIADYVQDDYNGFLISDYSIDEFQFVLSKIVLLSKVKLNQLKLNSYNCAIEKFSYTQYVNNMYSFIKKLN